MAMAQKKKPLEKFDKLSADTPILPSISSLMEVELVTNPEGGVLVIITRALPSPYWWAEYDIDLQQLYFVTVHGQLQGLGMKIHDVFEKRMINAKDVKIVRFEKNTGKMIGIPYIIPLVVRKHTLKD